jgi:hypothetical protein
MEPENSVEKQDGCSLDSSCGIRIQISTLTQIQKNPVVQSVQRLDYGLLKDWITGFDSLLRKVYYPSPYNLTRSVSQRACCRKVTGGFVPGDKLPGKATKRSHSRSAQWAAIVQSV